MAEYERDLSGSFVTNGFQADKYIQKIMDDSTLNESEKQVMIKKVWESSGQTINILLAGATGCGKSSTINVLFGVDTAVVGNTPNPETMQINKYDLNGITLWDSPGLGDDTKKDVEHAKKITDLLYKTNEDGSALIDIVLIIIDGSNRDMGTAYQVIKNVIIPAIGKENDYRLIVAINKADMAMSGRNWDYEKNTPKLKLQEFLDEKARSIHDRILADTGVSVNPIYYSAGYEEDGEVSQPYNVSKLMYYITTSVPSKKRTIVAANMNKNADVWKNSDEMQNYNTQIRRSIFDDIGEKLDDAFQTVGEIGSAVGEFIGGIGEAIAELFFW